MRPAGHRGSGTGHGGTIVEGSADVLVNGKPAIAVGHAAACPKHGKATVATGKNDVLVNGALMARLQDWVLCAGPPKPGQGDGALIDHGEPDKQIGDYDIHMDVTLADVPEKELDELVAAIDSGDPVRIQEAWRNIPVRGGIGKGTIKVVERGSPNRWIELEGSGPGGSIQGDPLLPVNPRVDQKKGGAQVGLGGSGQAGGGKISYVERLERDGAVVERRVGVGKSAGGGGGGEAEISDRRRGVWIDLPFVSGGVEEVVIEGAAGRLMPALDDIVPPVSPDVLLGD